MYKRLDFRLIGYSRNIGIGGHNCNGWPGWHGAGIANRLQIYSAPRAACYRHRRRPWCLPRQAEWREFTYTLTEDLAAGQNVTETVQYYKISDGEGHTDAGVLTLNITGTDAHLA
ncbi:hypothetical protein J2W92_005605 [Rhizobium leguminosarum]